MEDPMLAQGAGSEESDSDCETRAENEGFFDQLGGGFVPTSWDFTKAMQSAAGVSKPPTKSLVAEMIRDHALAEMMKRDEDGSDDNDDADDDATVDLVKNKEKEEFFEQPPPQIITSTFTEMNLSRPLLKAVGSLGYVHPTPIQASAIPIALAGKDICACAATGTGKTAAFMLPILERLLFRPQEAMTRVLVVLPTRELAVQVHAVTTSLAQHTSVTACLAAGGLDMRQQEAALRKMPDIVIATPGRLVDHLHNTPSFNLTAIEILVLDEADRMLQEHFEEQLHEILRLCYRGRQTMLFSATMTDEVEELISLSLNQPVRLFINNNTQVAANLQQEFVRIRSHREDSRAAIVAAMCCRSFSSHVIIFVPTKVLAHHLRIQLGLLGLNVEELHGDLTQLQRLEALDSFKKSEVDFLIATDLASRGLDIAGVKTVINYSMPSNIKQYVHRVGRTARAGQSGRSVTLVGEKERKMLKQIVKESSRSVKVRTITPDVVEKFSKTLADMEVKVKSILKQEAEEKEVRKAEMEVSKAQNLIAHRDEIYSRPKRTWLESGNKAGKGSNPKRQRVIEVEPGPKSGPKSGPKPGPRPRKDKAKRHRMMEEDDRPAKKKSKRNPTLRLPR